MKKSNLSNEVVIVGAGPIGLLLGCWLRKLGIDVRILEKRETRSTQSKAISMNAYSLAILHALGIYDQFDAAGKRVQDLQLYWEQNRLMRVNYRRLPSKYNYILCLEQPKTEALLESHFLASGGILQRGVNVSHLKEEADIVHVYTYHQGTDKEECFTARYVIGCDGGKSTVREHLGFSFTGEDHHTGFIMLDAVISWPGNIHCVHYFVSEDAFLILIPLTDNKHRIIIRTPNNEKEKIVGEKLPFYQHLVIKYGPKDLVLHDISWESSTTYYHRLTERYGQGRIWLAGDACHLFSSIGGLGMNTGFQDAFALAWRLAGILKNWFNETILTSYELERRALIQQLIHRTNEMTALITRVNRDPVALRDWLPIMANRRRLMTLPLHFSGLNQCYKKGFLDENGKEFVGQLIPYFKLIKQSEYPCSYDFIDGQHFILLHQEPLFDDSFWMQYKALIKLIQIHSDDWRSCYNETVLVRPDGIIIAKSSIQSVKNIFLSVIKPNIRGL